MAGVIASPRSNPHLGEEGIATLPLAMTGGRAEDRQTGWPDGAAIRYPMKDDSLLKHRTEAQKFNFWQLL